MYKIHITNAPAAIADFDDMTEGVGVLWVEAASSRHPPLQRYESLELAALVEANESSQMSGSLLGAEFATIAIQVPASQMPWLESFRLLVLHCERM